MHQTTVRFGPDLWDELEIECARLGISVAQYVREAALARLHYTAGRRGEADYERALLAAGAEAPSAAELVEGQMFDSVAVTAANGTWRPD